MLGKTVRTVKPRDNVSLGMANLQHYFNINIILGEFKMEAYGEGPEKCNIIMGENII
jgi:hypothetical protein